VPISFYLTARLPQQQRISEEWIKKNNFPAAPVICRTEDITDAFWKLDFLAKKYPHTIGFVDNEVHLPKVLKYKGKIIELVRHKKLTPHSPSVIQCRTWEEVFTILLNK